MIAYLRELLNFKKNRAIRAQLSVLLDAYYTAMQGGNQEEMDAIKRRYTELKSGRVTARP